MKMSAPAAAPAPTLHTAATTGKPDTTTNQACVCFVSNLYIYTDEERSWKLPRYLDYRYLYIIWRVGIAGGCWWH